MRRRACARGIACVVAILAATVPARAQTGSLTGADRIARVYDAILDARFEQVPDLLAQTCADGPAEAMRPHASVCDLLRAVSLWWQIQMDPADRSRDADFRQAADAAIAGVEAWVRAEPERAETWFYLGGAYGARSQWRVLRGERLAAARDGKRIKASLERALEIDPSLKDAYFGIGLYHYYADVAPAAARLLRFLLLLPGGDRVLGLRQMLEARNGGQLLRSEADYQLHLLYLWYENQPLRARSLVEGLAARHPRNPHFPEVIATITDTYLHDDAGSLRAWLSMLAAAQDGRLEMSRMAESRARIGAATHLERLHAPDRVLAMLAPLLATPPSTPVGAHAEALLLRARALDRLGRRDEALDSYRRAIAAAGTNDPRPVVSQARTGLRTAPDGDETRAHRRSLEGWRALERGDRAAAERLIDEAAALRPDDPLVMYRQAKLRAAQERPAAALALFERAAAAPPPMLHPALAADACTEAAALLERTGQVARAIEYYRLAEGVFGADERTRTVARNALTRLSGDLTRAP